jgi:hypothetical protein
VYTTVYSVVVDGDTVIEAVVAQYSINKFHQLLFLCSYCCGPATNRCVCYFSVGIGFTVTVPFFVSREGQPFKVYTTVYSVVVDGDTVIEAVVVLALINKFHQLLFLCSYCWQFHYKPMRYS